MTLTTSTSGGLDELAPVGVGPDDREAGGGVGERRRLVVGDGDELHLPPQPRVVVVDARVGHRVHAAHPAEADDAGPEWPPAHPSHRCWAAFRSSKPACPLSDDGTPTSHHAPASVQVVGWVRQTTTAGRRVEAAADRAAR